MTSHQVPPSTRDRADALSPVARRLLAKAREKLSRMQPGPAEQSLTGVLALAPECAEAYHLMGIAAQMRGDYAKAIDALRRALAIHPDDAGIHMALGCALCGNGDVDAALPSLQRACELAPRMAAAWYNLGKAFKLQARLRQASDALQHALTLDPAYIKARIMLAHVQVNRGDTGGAVANYREVLRKEPENPLAWHALANLKTEPFDKGDVAKLKRALARPGATAGSRILLGFALAKALEDQDDYAASLDVLHRANALQRSRIDWDAAAHSMHVDAIAQAFDGPPPEALDADLGREVIFIVSVPRSGSTLIEQILASHSQVEGANEITDLPRIIEEESKRRGCPFPQWVHAATEDDWMRLGRDYLTRTERWRRQRARFTDKNLVTWKLVGAAMAMLPGARVVNCRRDPLETCLACYRQLFNDGACFSYDLDEMAAYYRDYDRLIRHWKQRYPDRMLDQSYESLLADTEGQVRRLLTFCGLDFEPACLTPHRTARTVLSTASAAQVRQPLRRDTSRSARYEKGLDGLREKLASGGPTGRHRR